MDFFTYTPWLIPLYPGAWLGSKVGEYLQEQDYLQGIEIKTPDFGVTESIEKGITGGFLILSVAIILGVVIYYSQKKK